MQMELSHKRARVELERAASTSARSYEVGSGRSSPGARGCALHLPTVRNAPRRRGACLLTPQMTPVPDSSRRAAGVLAGIPLCWASWSLPPSGRIGMQTWQKYQVARG